jgi:Carboxypeptidase regulatory-like domain/TonB dependent receptor
MAQPTHRHASKTLRVIAFSFCLLTMERLAMSQLPTATILGAVRDSTGAVLPGAGINAKNLETGLTRTSVSAEDGSYRLLALPVGAYEVRVELPGFRTEVRTGLTLTVSQEAVVNFALQVGAVEQTVAVTAEAPLVNTTSGALGGLVDERKVADLPLNGRNFIDLTLLQPGITQHRNLGVAASTVGMWFSSNGAPLRSNNYLLDGAILTNLTNGTSASQDGSTLGIEGIREYRVITNSFSAEYGMTMGSQVTMVTKGGTNTLHGSLFEYFRNSALDARNFFDYKTAASSRRLPAFTRNQFGGSVGGPIKKDKTFFFGVYEGLRQRFGVTTISNTIGAGCHGPAGGVITNTACPQLGTVPAVTISPATAPLLDLFPLPNLSNNRFTFPFTQPIKDDYAQGRVDQMFSSADRMFGRYTFSDTTETDPLNYPQFRTLRFSRSSFATLSEDHVFSPTLLSTFRMSFSRTHPNNPSPSGIIGPQYSFVPGEEIGTMNIGGVTSMGPNVAPTNFRQNIFTWSDDIFYTRGRHSLKFGTLINHYQDYIYTTVNAVGTVTFANVSNFLQGLTSTYSAQRPGSLRDRTYHWNTFGFYAQDDFRVLKNLTFNLGLRYEFITVPNEVHGKEAALRNIRSDATPTLGPAFQNMSLRNFSPRFGFAWDVTGDGKTAVRGGFAELYDVGVFGVSLVIASQATPPFGAFCAIATPSTLALPLPFPGGCNTLRILDYGLKQPHILDYNLTVERQLPWNMGLTLGYAGSRGYHLMQDKEGNPTVPQILPDGRKFWPTNPVAPRTNPNWGSIDLHTAEGNSWYNAFQFGLNKRLSNGMQFQSSYTWAKVIDETQGQAGADNQVSSIFGVDPTNRRIDRGPADFDMRHNWQFNAIYQVPQPFNGRALRAVLGGWRASSILSVQSGYPFTPSLRTNWSRSGVNAGQPGAGSGNFDRPNLVPGRTKQDIILGRPERYFDPSAFTLQDAGFLGTSGRNYLTGPGYFNLDFSLGKNIPINKLGENGALEFRSEFFNVLNHPNFAMNDVARQVFAGAASGEAPLSTAGVITTTGSARSRQIQFALKLLF